MRFQLKIVLVFIVLFSTGSCVFNYSRIIYIGNWEEKRLPFSESIFFNENNDLLEVILSYKDCCNSSENIVWLRQKENLSDTYLS